LTAPFLIPCLDALRAEFNTLSPKRDKGADGWIGDTAHQASASDHNPDPTGRVLAVDIDSTGPWPGAPFTELVERIVDAHRAGTDRRLQYVIWDRHIAGISSTWHWEAYTGTADPHTGHAHFSGRHDHHGEADTSAWGIEDDMTPDQIATAVWSASWPEGGGRVNAGQRLADAADQLTAAALDARLTALEKGQAAILDLLTPKAAQ
jgi:hypothetical protein